MARPTKMTDEVLKDLRQAYMWGATNAEACAYAEIGERTLYDYLAENKEFSQEIENWKSEPILKAKKTIVEDITNTKTAQWYLERRAKKEYGANVDITTDGKELPSPILGGIAKGELPTNDSN